LLNLFTSLALILSEILPFGTWLQANGLLHGLLLISQTLWLHIQNKKESGYATQVRKTLNSILPMPLLQ
jgi:hypothetical protein